MTRGGRRPNNRDMTTSSSSTALRLVLWGTLALSTAVIVFVAWKPGPELPAVYGHVQALHDSLVRGAAGDESAGLLGRVEAGLEDGVVTTWLYRRDGALVSVHRTDATLPRPRGAGSIIGLPSGSYGFDRGELLVLVTPSETGAVVVAGYAALTPLRATLDSVLRDGPGPPWLPARPRLEATKPPRTEPRPSAPADEQPEPSPAVR